MYGTGELRIFIWIWYEYFVLVSYKLNIIAASKKKNLFDIFAFKFSIRLGFFHC